MKKTSITISFDEEKLSALKMYLSQRGVQVESEPERSLETLYTSAEKISDSLAALTT